MLATRSTQTNEVGRCTALLPAFAAVARAQDRPLALVDLGASAGLHLLFDRYAYSYRGPAGVVPAGDAASPVGLEAELRAGELPDLALPPVAHRAGIDRHPVDPDDEDQSRWLLACQWPDHLERFARLRAALDLARATPDRARVAEGDMVRDLPAAAAAAPADAHLCLYHCWAVAYLPPERQRQLVATIEGVARERPVSWVFAELPYEVPSLPVPPAPGDRTVKGATALVRVEFGPGRRAARRLADVHPHGRWIHWWPDSAERAGHRPARRCRPAPVGPITSLPPSGPAPPSPPSCGPGAASADGPQGASRRVGTTIPSSPTMEAVPTARRPKRALMASTAAVTSRQLDWSRRAWWPSAPPSPGPGSGEWAGSASVEGELTGGAGGLAGPTC